MTPAPLLSLKDKRPKKKEAIPASLMSFLLSTHHAWTKEVQFDKDRKWRFDCANPIRMVAIEIEGAIFSRGRHSRGVGMAKDMEKYNRAQMLGWTVFRYPAEPKPYISKITQKETPASVVRRMLWQKAIEYDINEFLTGRPEGQKELFDLPQAKLLSEKYEENKKTITCIDYPDCSPTCRAKCYS